MWRARAVALDITWMLILFAKVGLSSSAMTNSWQSVRQLHSVSLQWLAPTQPIPSVVLATLGFQEFLQLEALTSVDVSTMSYIMLIVLSERRVRHPRVEWMEYLSRMPRKHRHKIPKPITNEQGSSRDLCSIFNRPEDLWFSLQFVILFYSPDTTADETITSRLAIIQYLYNSFKDFNWLQDQVLSATLEISRTEEGDIIIYFHLSDFQMYEWLSFPRRRETLNNKIARTP